MQQIDQSLVLKAKQGQEAAIAALITRMMPAIRKGAAVAVAPGLDFDDAVQEGLIGLFDAIRGYDTNHGAPFAGYAAACIAHAQQDARRAALRKKHAPLNYSVPLPEDSTLPGPEDLAIASEAYSDVLARIDTQLSTLERAVLLASLRGQSTATIAGALHRTPKTVENALARARRKLRSTP